MTDSKLKIPQEEIIKPAKPERPAPGVRWSKYIKLHATPESIEQALWQAGLLSLSDLDTRPNEAIGAIQAAYRLDLATLRAAVRREASDG